MTTPIQAPLHTWLADRLPVDVAASVARLRGSDDVRHLALMPDVHLAQEVCVGAVVATARLLYPAAVGSDIGCGMAAVAVQMEAPLLRHERTAARLLAGLYQHVPTNKQRQLASWPAALASLELSDARLARLAERDGRLQLGTLGRGNHFLELQSDQQDQLWLMVHSGSRAMGQAIHHHHCENASRAESGLRFLDAAEESGRRYLQDVAWARKYAAENRLAMLRAVDQLLAQLLDVETDWDSLIHCDHNHVQQERHADQMWWIHRKGAQSARQGESGVIPGSMGTASFHTVGRGVADALRSCSHGAGRRLSRSKARQRVGTKDLARQLRNVWYDHRRAAELRDEAPAAYKDIRSVMRAQKKLVRVVRELRPLLNYKGT